MEFRHSREGLQFLHKEDGLLYFYDNNVAYECDQHFELRKAESCQFPFRERFPSKVVEIEGRYYGIHSIFDYSVLFELKGMNVKRVRRLPAVESYDVLDSTIVCYLWRERALMQISVDGDEMRRVETQRPLYLHFFEFTLYALTPNLELHEIDGHLQINMQCNGLPYEVTGISIEKRNSIVFNVSDAFEIQFQFDTMRADLVIPHLAELCQENEWDKAIGQLFYK